MPEFTYFFFFIFFFGLITWRNRPVTGSQWSGRAPEGSHRPWVWPRPQPGPVWGAKTTESRERGRGRSCGRPGFSDTTALPAKTGVHLEHSWTAPLTSPTTPQTRPPRWRAREGSVSQGSPVCACPSCRLRLLLTPQAPSFPLASSNPPCSSAGPAQELPWGASEAPLWVTTSTHRGSFTIIIELHPQLFFTYLF